MSTSLADITDYLSLQSDKVQANCKIITPSDLGAQYALHIDKKTPSLFVPRMPHSAMPSENDSCPRISAATTLLGCYVGYYRAEVEMILGTDTSRQEGSEHFLGAYQISRLDFEHALLPNDELVQDATRSGEVWLVAYNEWHREYTPIVIGEMFITNLKYTPVAGKKPTIDVSLAVRNNAADPIAVYRSDLTSPTSEYFAPTGTHLFHITFDNEDERDAFKPTNFQMSDLSASEYMRLRREMTVGTALESYKAPEYLSKWK